MSIATAKRPILPAEIPIELITAVQDPREQHPLNLAPLNVEHRTLQTGDYSLRGLEHHVAIERKSLPDLVQCCGAERDRFERAVERLCGFETKAVVVEASWADIEKGGWRGNVTPQVVSGSVLSWTARGLPFLFVGNHAAAGVAVARLLYQAARQRYRQLRELTRYVGGEVAE